MLHKSRNLPVVRIINFTFRTAHRRKASFELHLECTWNVTLCNFLVWTIIALFELQWRKIQCSNQFGTQMEQTSKEKPSFHLNSRAFDQLGMPMERHSLEHFWIRTEMENISRVWILLFKSEARSNSKLHSSNHSLKN